MRPWVRDAEDGAEPSVGQAESSVLGPEAHVQGVCCAARHERRLEQAARKSQAGMPPFVERRRVVPPRAVRRDACVQGTADISLA